MIKKIYYWFYHKTSASEDRGEYSSGYWQGKIRSQVVEWVRGNAGKILEIGCAEGLLLSRICQACPRAEVVGIDRDMQRVAKAQERIVREKKENVSAAVAEAANTGFPDAYFDTVICVNFLFMLASLDAVQEVLRELVRVVRPGGKIIFELRSSRNVFFVLKYRLAHLYDGTVAHQSLRTYAPETIHGLVRSFGFQVIHTKYIGFGSRWFAPIIMLEVKKP